MTNPTVSIVCTTYNQEKFISQAIEGFLMQQCDFDYEIIVHDDCSTDNTAQIVKEYEKKHPELIKPIYQKENIYSQGKSPWSFCFKVAKGKYIALCEGDDYWTDPLKLQKQVDFLEANEEYVISCHNSNIVDFQNNFKKLFNIGNIPVVTDVVYVLTNGWYIPTASMIFRKSSLVLPKWYYKVKNGDYTIQLLLTANGGFINYNQDVMSAYRHHDGGISSMFNKVNVFSYSMFFIHSNFNKFSKYKYNIIIKKILEKNVFEIMDNTAFLSKDFLKINLKLIISNKNLSKKHLIKIFNVFMKRIKRQ